VNPARQSSDVASPPAPARALGEQIIGVWSLLAYADEQAGQPDSHPFGATPEGVLMYTADGYVSAQLMDPARGLRQSAAWDHGTATEVAEAAAGYIAYCGRYVLDEQRRRITHLPQVALLPGLVGSQQHRTISLADGLLTLRTEPVPNGHGDLVSSRLEWRRIQSGRSSGTPGRASGAEAVLAAPAVEAPGPG
jgi:hypothetical protein